jgi:hypothetical protein
MEDSSDEFFYNNVIETSLDVFEDDSEILVVVALSSTTMKRTKGHCSRIHCREEVRR